jgi:hypothetical protein
MPDSHSAEYFGEGRKGPRDNNPSAPLPAADAAPPTAAMPPQPRAPSSPAFTSSEVGFGPIKVERIDAAQPAGFRPLRKTSIYCEIRTKAIGSAKHAPVAEPGSRDPGAGPRTALHGAARHLPCRRFSASRTVADCSDVSRIFCTGRQRQVDAAGKRYDGRFARRGSTVSIAHMHFRLVESAASQVPLSADIASQTL